MACAAAIASGPLTRSFPKTHISGDICRKFCSPSPVSCLPLKRGSSLQLAKLASGSLTGIQCSSPFFPSQKRVANFSRRLGSKIDVSASACSCPAEGDSRQLNVLVGAVVMFQAFSAKVASMLRRAASAVSENLTVTENDARLLEQLRGSPHGGLLLGAVVAPCFASLSKTAGPSPLTIVAGGMARWLELYSGVLLIRVLLSWFPNIPWERQPLMAIKDMCDPYLNLFRNILPPLFNALDLSPMLAFLVLGMLSSLLAGAA